MNPTYRIDYRAIALKMCAGIAVALTLLASASSAAPIQLLNWKPVPNVAGFPEIDFNGLNLQTDVGAQSNGDGNLPPANQTPGGLQSETIVNAPAPGSYASSVFTGGTGYYDTTLTFSGLAPIGPAVQTLLPFGGIVMDSQLLGPGSFILSTTNLVGVGGPAPVILLSGDINDAVITGVHGGAAGAVIDAHGVNYTGGIILTAGNFPAGAILNGNDLSLTLTSVTPTFGIGGTLQLNPFHADAVGEFDINVVAVPEPTTFALGAFAALALIGFRKRIS